MNNRRNASDRGPEVCDTRLASQTAFTLLELLVVIVVIGLLTAMLMPVFNRARARGRDSYCINNLRQLGIALTAYADEYDGHLPVAERQPSNPVDPLVPLPSIRELLESKAGGAAAVFQCLNDDVGRFEEEGASYEWNATFNGVFIDRPGFWIISIPPEKALLMYDYENFHLGKDGNGTKNAIFADGHVTPLS